ncbi:MAG: hypothetical protein Q7K33_00510 [Candidatus Berkelbacteria bacterium]|nr:hypothetical protein [Candidatus Berkelbacteria bacterium]
MSKQSDLTVFYQAISEMGRLAIAKRRAQGETIGQPSHHHAGQTSGPTHNDATAGTKQSDGSISYEKIHSDDK